MQNIFSEVVPEFMEPILRQGIADGSIHTDHPKEMAEAMMLLSDVWVNPVVQPTTPEETKARCAIYNQLMSGLGLPELIDQEIVDTLVRYGELSRRADPKAGQKSGD